MMEKLPDKPTSESALYALSQLDGLQLYIEHVQQYIKMQEIEMNHLKGKSTGLLKPISMDSHSSQSDDDDINTESFKILDASNHNDTTNTSNNHVSQTPSILVIEDDFEIGLMLKTILEARKHIVLVAQTGDEGIALAEEYIPTLILCDVHLPGMYGLDVVKMIKDNPKLADIPVLMLTADISEASESFKAGVSEYILKPIRRNLLYSYINKYIPPDE